MILHSNDLSRYRGKVTMVDGCFDPLHTGHISYFKEAKKIWVLSRNYQFKNFFQAVGLDWYDKEILERVKNKPLLKTDYWDFDKYSKEILFKFWKKCFDPRMDTYYNSWGKILKNII